MSTTENRLGDAECKERREAELEFVASAYEPEEAWCEQDNMDNSILIHRRLRLESAESCLPIRITLKLPQRYPVSEHLHVVDAKMELNNQSSIGSSCNAVLQKIALNASPSLLEVCRGTAFEHAGEESVFVVLSAAEEWIHERWPALLESNSDGPQQPKEEVNEIIIHETRVLGRRLIYSHHIIAKKKRADIKMLADDYELTGYMKIGWPGLLIIEGDEQDCNQFYNEIRPWSWQYLVVRGEQQEVVPRGKSMESVRRFANFTEVEDMSVVAEHCREVGLEALFRTSMKQYQDSLEELEPPNASLTPCYGALVLVDHMNDGKGYRKWLRKCGQEVGCFMFVKQFYPGDDYTNRPQIYVGLIGDQNNVAAFLKRWRTSRVDIDSKGKPCLERQMTILEEGELAGVGDPSDVLDWDVASSEDCITVKKGALICILSLFGWALS
jgi:Protein of unknown function (DUF1115)